MSSSTTITTTTTTTTTITGNNNNKKRAAAAVAQLCSTSNKYSNLIQIAQCAGWAQRGGAQMLFLPECFGFMGTSADETLQQAEAASSFTNVEDIDSGTATTSDETNNGNSNNNIRQNTNSLESLRTILRQVILQHASSLNNNDDEKARIESPPSLDTTTHDDENKNKGISILDGLKIIAQESGLWISGGGMHVLANGDDDNDDDDDDDDDKKSPPHHPFPDNAPSRRVYNTHVILDDQGIVQCIYRKIHLFDVSIPGKVELRESNTTAPGTELVVCDSPIGRLGLSTCYDVRFPEMYVQLVQEGGAQILLVPAAFTVPTGSAHWHVLLRARAIEHQCYVLAAAQYGRHNEKRESYGHSLAIDPWGQIVADAGGYDGVGAGVGADVGAGGISPSTVSSTTVSTGGGGTTTTTSTQCATSATAAAPAAPSVIFCDIDLEQLESIRQRMPIQQHRRSSGSSFSFLSK